MLLSPPKRWDKYQKEVKMQYLNYVLRVLTIVYIIVKLIKELS